MLTQDLEQREVVIRKDFPFLLLRSDFFSKMFDSLIKNYGSEGIIMIFNMGKDQGVEKVKELMKSLQWFDSSRSEIEILEKVLVKLNHMGWGKLDIENYNSFNKSLQLKVKYSPFVDMSSTEPNGGCYFLQGLIIGITSEIFEKEMSISDQRYLEDYDGFCQFNIINKNAKVIN